jgi:hypothetical protein
VTAAAGRVVPLPAGRCVSGITALDVLAMTGHEGT